jgi:L-lysine exporter family protein LysE/ArgO
MLAAFAGGMALGGGLIVAIGAQNAYIIRQGILNSHVFALCLFCAVSDAILIWAGTLGLGAIIKSVPAFIPVMTWGGALFLAWYGTRALRRALHPGGLAAGHDGRVSLAAALATCAAFTWANPHVYLDTVILVGSLANARPAPERMPFALGATAASFIWFFMIGYGARALAPFLSRPAVWRAIDLAIAAIMFWLAVRLVMG